MIVVMKSGATPDEIQNRKEIKEQPDKNRRIKK